MSSLCKLPAACPRAYWEIWFLLRLSSGQKAAFASQFWVCFPKCVQQQGSACPARQALQHLCVCCKVYWGRHWAGMSYRASVIVKLLCSILSLLIPGGKVIPLDPLVHSFCMPVCALAKIWWLLWVNGMKIHLDKDTVVAHQETVQKKYCALPLIDGIDMECAANQLAMVRFEQILSCC